MQPLVRSCAFILVFASVATISGSAQAGTAMLSQAATPAKPLESPNAMAEVSLDGAKITVHYNSPAIRGRVIMGGLVPYGQVWRTGANPATSFVTTGGLTIGTLKVPAGQYTLYTLPAAPSKPWLLIMNKQTGQWGTVYNEKMDLGRTQMQHNRLSAAQESMTIGFEKTTKDTTVLHIKWENADESVKIVATK